MDAVALYRAGELKPAIAALGEELKKQPLDAKRQTMLFELLCFAGEYDRAEKQLDMLADSSKEAAAGILVYKAALHAERTRQEMFARGEFPLDTARPSGPGAVNGTSSASFTDLDPRIGEHLEVFIAGSYTWIPLEFVGSLSIAAPAKLRDLIWAPAVLEVTPAFRLQDLGEVLLPALAPLSWRHGEDSVRLGRTTVWEDDDRFGSIPFGQKIFAADDAELGLLEVRSLTFE
ncbi:MAG: type VI secretion system accessory protein TagJ, partial [Acidobacteriaceae bacterium]